MAGAQCKQVFVKNGKYGASYMRAEWKEFNILNLN